MDAPHELPPSWSWARFTDVCERVSVGHVGPTTSFFNSDGDGVKFIRSQDVRPGRLMLAQAATVTKEFHAKLKKSQLRAGDVLIVRVGANRGDCCVVPNGISELNCANIVFARPNDKSGFYGFFFRSPVGQQLLLRATTGAAQGVINTGSVAQMPVPVPPRRTRERIVGILSAYDDLIENNQRRIQILEQMARGLYREWFVNLRFPGHESVPRVDSALGSVPKGWSVCKLGDILELNYGRALKKEDRRDGAVPVFGSSGVVGSHDESIVTGPGIVVGRKGNVGSVFWSDDDFFVIDTAYFVTAKIPLRFLFYDLQSKNFINNDAAVPGLSRHQAYALQTIVPPNELLVKFCSLADEFEALASTLRRATDKLRSARDLLLPRLLSGQINLEDAADSAA